MGSVELGKTLVSQVRALNKLLQNSVTKNLTQWWFIGQ